MDLAHRRLGVRRFIAAALLIVAVCRPALTQPRLPNTDTFKVAFGMSYTLEPCGDKDFGRIFRRAILEKFAGCPFPAAARKDFYGWAGGVDKLFRSQLSAYFSSHPGIPDKDNEGNSCNAQLTSQAYLTGVARLKRYELGELTAEDIIPDRCDTPAGYP